MPVTRFNDTEQTVRVGDYFVNVRTGTLVEIMDVDLSGNVMVLDAAAPLDGEWQRLMASQIGSVLWRPVDEFADAA